ncbi:nitroreductase family protein [Paraflavitalea sp. CAU 1676]|jgi:nitroreductase|uniref:nitroreductase family protein n=1 Tax=Paraflavitalea sp. CAU 1676 TaxID=3032598 RepID=UPI0023DA4686|nr:nitroreductase family protein [Paraflavitalea sp. CAU 1676]MDF2188184.1 nitroreductase family protein [Paraflavitalea sp. CAU 1676]
MSTIKTANTQYPVIDLIKKRWSPRSFSNKPIAEADMLTILEAGSWAPSANNSQPWRHVYAFKGTEGFEKIWNTLLPGNQPWTKDAAALVVSIGIKELPDTQQKNAYYLHDVGMFNSFLLLQAQSMNIYGHLMAGFDKRKLAELLNLPENEEAVSIMALGYTDAAEKLQEPYKSREISPRTRKALEEFTSLMN